MFEGETQYIEQNGRREDAPAKPPAESQIVFLPAPYFLLALGAGLFLGLVM